MLGKMNEAIEQRKQGNLKESNSLLLELVGVHPNDAVLNYQCAWSYDVLGEETKAVPFYEKAIELGLSGKELEGAFLGLGSTYRTIGEYEKSKETFSKAIAQFPNNKALQVFYSMTLYNLKQHHQAMEILLNCLLETTTDEDILRYTKALRFYSTQLDTVWS